MFSIFASYIIYLQSSRRRVPVSTPPRRTLSKALALCPRPGLDTSISSRDQYTVGGRAEIRIRRHPVNSPSSGSRPSAKVRGAFARHYPPAASGRRPSSRFVFLATSAANLSQFIIPTTTTFLFCFFFLFCSDDHTLHLLYNI